MFRRIGALILLIALLVVPFINWRLGAWLWLCAGLVHVFQGLFRGRPPLPPDIADEEEEVDALPDADEANGPDVEADSK